MLENGAIKFVKSVNTKLLFVCTFEIDLITEILIAEHQDCHYGIVNMKCCCISKEFKIDFVHLCESF